nr:T9SS type A sorting domain-containing protein [Catalimonadaceae bacterium]
ISAKSNTYAETVTVNKSLTLQNDGTTIINNLTMNGTGKTLTLASDFEVSTSGVLTLTDGLINTGSNFLRVTNTASGAISGGSYLSHVLGNLNRAITTGVQYDYNVGDGTDQQLLTLTFTTISSLTDVNVRYTTTAPGTSMTTFNESGALYDDVLQTGYWIVDPNVGGTATNYSMRLKPINFTDYPTGAGIYSYTILKRVGAGTWGMNGVFDDPGTPERIFGDGTVRRSTMSGFSNFSIGTSQNVPLPLNLVYFSARKKGNSAETNWKTVNEKGVSRFELEKSYDGKNFTTITSEKSKNESGAQYTYSDADAFRLNQDVVYYRLKSVELNGLPNYSAIRIVNRLATASETLTLFPNPVKDKVYLAGANSQTDEVIVTDATGKTVNIRINEEGALDVENLAPGIYHIRLLKDGTSLDARFVKD